MIPNNHTKVHQELPLSDSYTFTYLVRSPDGASPLRRLIERQPDSLENGFPERWESQTRLGNPHIILL